MKNIGFLAALLMAPCAARAIKPASSTEHAAIQVLIDQANEINKSSNPNLRDLFTAKADLDSEERKPEYLQNHADVDRLRTEVRSLKTTRDKLYQQAIQRTLLAYDLVGHDANGKAIMPTKPAVHPVVKGRDIHWIVVYKDNEDRLLLDNKGEPRTIGAAGDPVGGQTGVDGVTTMYGKFASTIDLAVLLFHERVHYDQFTTAGVGDKLTRSEREYEAYKTELHRLGEFGLTPAEFKAFQLLLAGDGRNKPGKIRENYLKGREERTAWVNLQQRLGLWNGAEPAGVQPRSQAEYDAMLLASKDFDSQLAAAGEAAKAQAREQAKIAQRDHDERLTSAYIGLAHRFCANSGSVTQAELDALPEPNQANFYLQKVPLNLGDCVLNVYLKLAGSLVANAAEIEELAEAYAPRTPVAAVPVRQTPAGAVPVPPGPVAAFAIQPSPFAMTFPDLAQFAVDSCRQPGSGSSPHMNAYPRPYWEFLGERVNWEGWYQRQASGMQGCPRELFTDLVNLALEGTYWKVSYRGWLEAQVARYSPSQGGPGSGSRGNGGPEVPEGPDHNTVRRRLGGVFAPK